MGLESLGLEYYGADDFRRAKNPIFGFRIR